MTTLSAKMLNNLPSYIIQDVALPWHAALEVMEPVILQLQPDHVDALELFKKHIEDRDVEISIQQIAYYWENFLGVFVSEIPKRLSQWANSRNSTSKNPLQLFMQFSAIQSALYVSPIRTRLDKENTAS